MKRAFGRALRALETGLGEALEKGDHAGADALLWAAIRAAPDAASLWKVIQVEQVSWSALTFDGELAPEDVRAILERGLAFEEPGELATGLGIVGVLATLGMQSTLVPGEGALEPKRGTRGVVADMKERIRALFAARSARVRAGARMLVARAPDPTGEDLAEACAAIGQRAAEALGAALLAASMIAHARAGTSNEAAQIDALRTAASARIAHASAFVRIAAAFVVAVLGGDATGATREVFAQAARDPAPLPASWGFFDSPRKRDTTHDLAATALGTFTKADHPVACAIARHGDDAEVLLGIAFPDPAIAAFGGVALADLDEAERALLARAAELEPEWHHRWALGFHDIRAEVPGFLRADSPRWKPVEVTDAAGIVRRWHPELLWRKVVFGALVTCFDAAAALAHASDPSVVLDLALDRSTRVILHNQGLVGAALERDRALIVALLDALLARGHDVAEDVARRSEKDEPLGAHDRAALGVCLVHLAARPAVRRLGAATTEPLLREAARVYPPR